MEKVQNFDKNGLGNFFSHSSLCAQFWRENCASGRITFHHLVEGLSNSFRVPDVAADRHDRVLGDGADLGGRRYQNRKPPMPDFQRIFCVREIPGVDFSRTFL
jgi:hypothetical protein